MKPPHEVSRAAIELIKRFEGYRRNAAQLADGRWTIGYGHTLSARKGAHVSEADAEALLLYDLMAVASAVRGLVYAELTQNQFDALCAFAFSIGLDAFRRSDVLKRVNEGAFAQAAFAMELWRRAEFEGERIVIDALIRRRAAEKLLFLTPANDAWRPVPSAVLKPELDPTGLDLSPRDVPAVVSASLDGETAAVTREPAALTPKPEPSEPGSHPSVTAAAEAVSSRLQTLFADEPEAPVQPQSPAAATQEAPPLPGPESIDFAVSPQPESPIAAAIEAASLRLESLFAEIGGSDAPQEPAREPAKEEAPEDLFAAVAARQSAREAPPEPDPFARLFDDTPQGGEPPAEAPRDGWTQSAPAWEAPASAAEEPAPFVASPVRQVRRAEPEESAPAAVGLIIVGVIFFLGGVYWGLNGESPDEPGIFTPALVGWLAGLAGIGFLAAGVFILLQRMVRAAERREKRRA